AGTSADFADAGCSQWIYPNRKTGRDVAMPYWTVPDAALDDPDEMALWARKALEAGKRTGR
nr:TfoX/Sxy family protein [Pseudomonadota bacterium]